MSVEATAEALAPETAAPIETPQTQETPPEPSVQDELAAIWDKDNAEQDDPTPQEPEAKVEVEDQPLEEPAPEPEKVEIPTDIPKQLKAHWEKLPEDTRQDVQDFARETNRKLAEQGRMMHGISPIRDSLVEAAKQFPQLADMKPQDVAKEVFQLAKVSADFRSKPIETILGLAKQHGIEQQLSQALQGQPVQDTTAPMREIMQQNEALRREVAELKDPEYIRSQVTAVTSEQATVNEVQNFAKTAEHWDKVEDTIPELIPAVQAKMGQDASPSDVLKAAYDLAVSWVVPTESKAPETATDEVAPTDPEKAKAVLKAKSVNVTGKPSKPRTLSAREEMSAIWDKNNK